MNLQKTTSRLIAGATAFAFFWTQAAEPLAAADFWTERREARASRALAALPAEPGAVRVTREIPPAPLASPAERLLGDMSAEKDAGARPDVFLVKDVHAQADAQRGIAEFLDRLGRRGPVLVGVEGAAGPLNFRPYRALAEDGVIRRLADAYLASDWIQAPEYAGLTGPASLRLVGVEELSLYKGNVAAYRRAAALKPRVEAALRWIKTALPAAEARIFTPAQTAFSAGAARYRAGTLDTGDYLDALSAEAPVDARRFPQVRLFLKARSAERALDFPQADRERAALAREVGARLTKDRLDAFAAQALDLRQGGRAGSALQTALLKEARRAGIDIGAYPTFRAYVAYAALADGIDRAGLLNEVSRLEDAAWAALRPDARQEALRSLAVDLDLAERLAGQALTDDQWTLWEDRLPALRTLPARARALGVDAPLEIPLEAFEAFYRFARRRDGALLENFLAARRPGEAAVLVAGGFHAAGIAQALGARGLAVSVLTPRLGALEKDKNALEVFTRGPSDLDRVLLGDRLFLAKPVSIGPAEAPRPGPGYAAVAGFPVLVGALAAVEDPGRAPEILKGVADRAAAAKLFPLRGPFPAGDVRREAGATVVPLSVMTPSGRSIPLEAVAGPAAGGRRVFPSKEGGLSAAADGGDAPFSLRTAPAAGDAAARWGRFLLPGLDALVFSMAWVALANPWAALAAVAVSRGGYALWAFLNERGHLLRADQLGLGEKVWTDANLRGNLPGRAWLAMLVPFAPSLWGDPHVVTGASGKTSDSISQRGWIYGGVLAAALAAAASPLVPEPLRPFLWVGLAAAALVSSVGDLFLWNVAEGVHACGINVVIQEWPDAGLEDDFIELPADQVEALLENLAGMELIDEEAAPGDAPQHPGDVESYLFETGSRVKEFRGHHSMGMVTMLLGKNGAQLHFRKAVNPKRAELTRKLIRQARPLLNKMAKSKGRVRIALAHWRVSTSSDPTKAESHPFQWMPDRLALVYEVVGGELVPVLKIVGNSIGANGDFDFFKWFGRPIPNGEVKAWMGRVLGVLLPLKGDSPAIAAMMDFLHTKGQWLPSLRLAYQTAVAQSTDDRAPSQELLAQWEEFARKRFDEHAARGFLPDGSKDLKDAAPEARAQLARALAVDFSTGEPFQGWVPPQKAQALAEAAVEAFVENDLYAAARQYMERAVGTFGVGFVSTLAPDRFVVSSLGQSVFVGFDHARRIASASSDGVVLKVPFGGGKKKSPMRYRWYTDNKGGEVFELSMPRRARAETQAHPRRLPVARVYSLALKRELTPGELSRAGRMELLNPEENGYITPIPEMDLKNPVRGDLQDTAGVLKAIRAAAQDPKSFNAQTAQAFADLVMSRKDPRVILTGFAESRLVLKQFADDLKALFPGLRVETISSNKVVKNRERIQVGPEDIVLAASHSGQTAATFGAGVVLTQKQRKDLEELKAFEKTTQDLRTRMKASGNDAFFTLTGEMDSMLGYLTGQKYYKGAPFLKRNLTNLAGFRPSEAVTLTTVANHAVMTELLYALARKAARRREPPYGFTLPKEDLKAAERRMDYSAQTAAALITGALDRETPVKSKVHEQLTAESRELSQIILETAVTTALTLGYLYALLALHLPLLPSQLLAAAPHALGCAAMYVPHLHAAGQFLLHASLPSSGWMSLALGHLDFVLLGFMAWWEALAIRKAQGRSLWARTGKRLVVFADEQQWVGLSMKILMAKLTALSFGVASAESEGGDLDEDYAEVIQHKTAQRGTKVYLGRADGRLSKELSEAEASALMAGKQTNTNKHYVAGPETVTIGHNPARDANASKKDIVLPDDPGLTASTADGAVLLNRVKSMERLIAMQVMAEDAIERVTQNWVVRLLGFIFGRYRKHRTRGGARTATTATFGPLGDVFDTSKASPPTFTDAPVKLPFQVAAASAAAPAADEVPAEPPRIEDADVEDVLEPEEDPEIETEMDPYYSSFASGRTFLALMHLPDDTEIRALASLREEASFTPRRGDARPRATVTMEVFNLILDGHPAAATARAADLKRASPLEATPVPQAPSPAPASGRYELQVSIQPTGTFFRRLLPDDLTAMPAKEGELTVDQIESVRSFLGLLGAPEDTLLRAPSDPSIALPDRPRRGDLPPLLTVPLDVLRDVLAGRALDAALAVPAKTAAPPLRVKKTGAPAETAAAPSAEPEMSWLEIRRGEGGAPTAQTLRPVADGFLARPVNPDSPRVVRARERLQGFLAYLDAYGLAGVPLRVSLNRRGSVQGFLRFLEEPGPAIYLTKNAFLRVMADPSSYADVLRGAHIREAAPAPLSAPDAAPAGPAPEEPQLWEVWMSKEGALKARTFLLGDGRVSRLLIPVAQQAPLKQALEIVRRNLHVPPEITPILRFPRGLAAEQTPPPVRGQTWTMELPGGDFERIVQEGPVRGFPWSAADENLDGERQTPLEDRLWEFVRTPEGLRSRVVDLGRPEAPARDLPGLEVEESLKVEAFLRKLPPGFRLRVLFRNDNPADALEKDPRLAGEGPVLTVSGTDFDLILKDGPAAAQKILKDASAGAARFGWRDFPPELLLLWLVPGGLLAALAGATKAAAAAVAGAAPSDGAGFWGTVLVAAATGIAVARARLAARKAPEGAAPLSSALKGLKPAVVTADLVDGKGPLVSLSAGLPGAGPRGAPDLILHVSAKEAGSLAALVAAEIARRRADGGGTPAVFLVTEDGSPAKAAGALLKALARWRGPDGPLTPRELAGARARLAAAPAKDFRETDGLDAGRAREAAAKALGLKPGAPVVLLSREGRRWKVPAALKEQILVLDLVLPGIASVLSPESWKAWKAAAVSA